MILDRLENAQRYAIMHPLFSQAFTFLARTNVANLPNGRHDIVGDQLFAIIDRGMGRGREASLLEFHRKYIDIQFVIAGSDEIGWRPLVDCERVSTAYDSEKEVGFYFDRPDTWLAVPAGAFAIFYPEDAHAPLACTGAYHKAVVKVGCD